MTIAVYAGTFDPPTLGHFDVARRAARVFDRLIFAIFVGREGKVPLFTPEERKELACAALADVPNVVVDSYRGLTVDYARQMNAAAIVKGLRAVSDFEDEFAQAHMNDVLAPELESVFLMTTPKYAFVSSSLIKEVARAGGDVSSMVSAEVEQALRRKFAART